MANNFLPAWQNTKIQNKKLSINKVNKTQFYIILYLIKLHELYKPILFLFISLISTVESGEE